MESPGIPGRFMVSFGQNTNTLTSRLSFEGSTLRVWTKHLMSLFWSRKWHAHFQTIKR